MNEDLSGIFEKLNINKDSISPEMMDNIMTMFNNINSSNSKDENSNQDNSNNNNTIDFDTVLKMKSMFDKFNSNNDPRYKLLLSLKPYLRESRQGKLDQYIQISKVLQILPLINGDNNGTK